jgi:hypothetical protein
MPAGPDQNVPMTMPIIATKDGLGVNHGLLRLENLEKYSGILEFWKWTAFPGTWNSRFLE